MSVTTTTRIVRNPDLVHTELEGFTMKMNIAADKYFSLNPTGSRIWQLVEQPVRVADVVSTLEQEYNVPADRCRDESIRLIETLLSSNLVRIVD